MILIRRLTGTAPLASGSWRRRRSAGGRPSPGRAAPRVRIRICTEYWNFADSLVSCTRNRRLLVLVFVPHPSLVERDEQIVAGPLRPPHRGSASQGSSIGCRTGRGSRTTAAATPCSRCCGDDAGDELALPAAARTSGWSKRRGEPGRQPVGDRRRHLLGLPRPVDSRTDAEAAREPPLRAAAIALLRKRVNRYSPGGSTTPGRDFERLEQPLVGRVQVEDRVHAVARLEVPVERRDVQVPAFDQVIVEPGEPREVEVVEHLLDVQKARAADCSCRRRGAAGRCRAGRTRARAGSSRWISRTATCASNLSFGYAAENP